VVQTQRTATLRHLQDLTRLKQRATTHHEAAADGDGQVDLAWLLVLENLIYSGEAEVRWLDHVEARLVREANRPRRSADGIPTAADDGTTVSGTQVVSNALKGGTR
jgi:hypothetical protein